MKVRLESFFEDRNLDKQRFMNLRSWRSEELAHQSWSLSSIEDGWKSNAKAIATVVAVTANCNVTPKIEKHTAINACLNSNFAASNNSDSLDIIFVANGCSTNYWNKRATIDKIPK